MIDSIVGADFDTADAVVIGVPYEQTASFGTGAKNGPIAVKEVLDQHLEFFDRYSETVPAEDFSYAFKNLNEVTGLSPEIMVEKVRTFLKSEDRFYVLLGGVHSVSIPSLQSIATKHNPEEVTVVQIDAHFDLRDDDSDYNDEDPNKFAHSTVMRRAHEMNFRILPVGIRTMYKEEFNYVQSNKINYFEWSRTDREIPTIEDIVSAIQTDKVYLTIDIDGFDPSVMPGTGTPVPGGLSWEFGEKLIKEIMLKKNVVAADLVELAPQEHTGQTEYNVGQLTYLLLTANSLKS